jgi:RNA polymerase sigma-70 factor (ECF subfamily)
MTRTQRAGSGERHTDVNAVQGASLAPTTDAHLVERAALGDVAAFEALVESRLDRAHRTASAILGNPSDAHDVVQESFLAAWRHLPRLRDPRKFDAWLAKTIVNRCRDVLRRRQRSPEVALDASVDASDDGGMLDVDRDVALTRAFEQLSAEQRFLLVMHHLHGTPIAELAAETDTPEGTLKWRLHAARAALQRALETQP